jgi:GDSL-like Lipase/Acylhydrolase
VRENRNEINAPSRRFTIVKIVFYATACAALSASFFLGDLRRITSDLQFWGLFAAFQAALLASLIPFRSLLLKQISIALTALMVMNLFSPLLALIRQPVTTLEPNINRQFRVAGGEAFGVDGIQTITTDSKGYRTNTPIDYDRKEPGTLRIVAIGGSTTEDIYLDDAKTWTSLLAAHLSKALDRPVEMINTGVSGLRAQHHLFTLLESEKFSPDIAVVMLGINTGTGRSKRESAAASKKLSPVLAVLPLSTPSCFKPSGWSAGPPAAS